MLQCSWFAHAHWRMSSTRHSYNARPPGPPRAPVRDVIVTSLLPPLHSGARARVISDFPLLLLLINHDSFSPPRCFYLTAIQWVSTKQSSRYDESVCVCVLCVCVFPNNNFSAKSRLT